METKKFQIEKTPAIIWGAPSKRIYLYIHGQGGKKEEAEIFAKELLNNNLRIICF